MKREKPKLYVFIKYAQEIGQWRLLIFCRQGGEGITWDKESPGQENVKKGTGVSQIKKVKRKSLRKEKEQGNVKGVV